MSTQTELDPAAEAQRLLYNYREHGDLRSYNVKLSNYPSGQAILDASPAVQVAVVLNIMKTAPRGDWRASIVTALFRRDLPYTAEDMEQIAALSYGAGEWAGKWKPVLRLIERFRNLHGLTPALRGTVQRMHDDQDGYMAESRKLKAQAAKLLDNANVNPLFKGGALADAVHADLEKMELSQQANWLGLLRHTFTADAGKPSGKWQKEANNQIMVVGESIAVTYIAGWLSLASPPSPFASTMPPRIQNDYSVDGYIRYRQENAEALEQYRLEKEQYEYSDAKNIDLLKGWAWCCVGRSEPELARALGHLVGAAFHKMPGVGPWAARAGNAAIYALGQMTCAPEAVGQLSRLRTKMRDRSALKAIAAAIEQVAVRSGMAAEDLEDLAVPTGGLDADGTRRITFGDDGSALLTLHPQTGHVSSQWFGADGKERKSMPAAIKKMYGDDIKALKAAEEEIKQALSAQTSRLDHALLEERVWTYANWESRFLAHPLLGNLARRLIWAVDGQPALPLGNAVVEGTTVALWHPITSTPADVMRWRDKLVDAGIVQPFKQAHREIYLLTDAERNTRTYSNRFAAHVLKQHQFNSLCILRGWQNKLRLMVDDSYPPATRELPRHNLRAEFWVEGIGDDYGTDTNETGTYLRLSTDQVRFYQMNDPANYAHAGGGGYTVAWRQTPVEPLPLEQVPPLVLSEILRDVDLFVGVASVGNDPTWTDGGPEGRFRNYWQDYSFGDLGETAKTRRAVLERLLPRLKIAGRAELTDKFLKVRGDLRTYKIHLGSGNILMEPNDQYLCIVPNARDGGAGDVFLPFEGDRTLAIILSKAFLLADDTKIADPTITRQIHGHSAAIV